MRFTKTQTAYALLLVCAAARLFLQMAAMPPYAGLDEVYHVARLAFVRAEHRNPTTTEVSIPPYLMESIAAAHEPRPAAPRQPTQLTNREREVARLVSLGLTNRGIADALGIATATATLHVEHIRGKLGFHSRAQIATWIARAP